MHGKTQTIQQSNQTPIDIIYATANLATLPDAGFQRVQRFRHRTPTDQRRGGRGSSMSDLTAPHLCLGGIIVHITHLLRFRISRPLTLAAQCVPLDEVHSSGSYSGSQTSTQKSKQSG